MAIQPGDPVLARLLAKLPKGKRSKKLLAMLPVLAEIMEMNQNAVDSPPR